MMPFTSLGCIGMWPGSTWSEDDDFQLSLAAEAFTWVWQGFDQLFEAQTCMSEDEHRVWGYLLAFINGASEEGNCIGL